ncbi:hypothetical protein CPB83DRAFT_843224 [Crepidotus variabilis]|uniref:Uncharacterized protein n=1 Tax=Crepidotus variabilis TaxID=179855 RepID=A0A9P6EUJ7_9AGAR|nr:hypothetical protein CPB83DRAFT_843224 [Crepidotus variabilis]
MPALGETPITSYFSRTPSLSKRKNVPEDDPEPANSGGKGALKRLKQSPASASKHSNSSPLKKVKGSDIEDFFQTNNRNGDSNLNTPMTKMRSKGKATALPTPPTTGGVAASRRTVSEAVYTRQPLTPLPRAAASPSKQLPTPSTLMKPAIPKRRLDEFQTQAGPPWSMVSADSEEMSVPSSQSQLSDDVELSMPPPRTLLTSKSTLLDFDDDDDFVPSSQSQPSLNIITSPRRRPRKVQPEATFEIPTSQSQERELEIPPEFINRDQGRNSPRKSPTKLPQRTLSDELFPIPIQESPFAGIFPDVDNLADTEDPPGDTANFPPSQGSVTESETEDEDQEDSRRLHKASSIRKPKFSQLSTTQSSQSSIASYADASFSSLPDAVREFRSMFGEGDGSYPADFPESLR